MKNNLISLKLFPSTAKHRICSLMPEVAACLNNGIWTMQAEQKLLERYRLS
jgi:hypothetical protein